LLGLGGFSNYSKDRENEEGGKGLRGVGRSILKGAGETRGGGGKERKKRNTKNKERAGGCREGRWELLHSSSFGEGRAALLVEEKEEDKEKNRMRGGETLLGNFPWVREKGKLQGLINRKVYRRSSHQH